MAATSKGLAKSIPKWDDKTSFPDFYLKFKFVTGLLGLNEADKFTALTIAIGPEKLVQLSAELEASGVVFADVKDKTAEWLSGVITKQRRIINPTSYDLLLEFADVKYQHNQSIELYLAEKERKFKAFVTELTREDKGSFQEGTRSMFFGYALLAGLPKPTQTIVKHFYQNMKSFYF